MDVWSTLPTWAGPVLVGLSVASGMGLVGAAIALPRILASLPEDWLLTPEARITHVGRWTLRVLVAAVLTVAGVAMLVLPGQGVLTLLAAGVVSPLRGKKRVVRWVMSFEVVHGAVTLLRRQRGQGPLLRDQRATDNGVSARS
ncbi:MAG: hypothetical protein AAF211_11745 [Myxococcota bacterium]